MNIKMALTKLDSKFKLFRMSSVYESPSIGGSGPNFLNCIVAIKTELHLDVLKTKLRRVEESMGRVRSEDKNAPRQIDIDILIYADQVLDEEVWTLPHLAIPLVEIYPSLINIERGKTLKDIADELYKKYDIFRRDDIVTNMSQLTSRSA